MTWVGPHYIPDNFVSGTVDTGRLVLLREHGSEGRCDVLMCRGRLVANGDCTFDIVSPGS